MSATPIKIFIKDPAAVLDYALRWTKWLKGDIITTSTWVSSSPLVVIVGTTTLSADLTVLWLSGGIDGTNYLLTNTVVTAGGRTESRTIQISARSR